MYEIFALLLEQRHLKAADVCKGTGLPSSLFSEWKRGKSTPKADKLKKIADFFEVSVEYLMTGEENTPIYYTNEETARLAQEMYEDEDMRSLFDMKRNMPPERFKAHIEFMKNLYDQEKGNDI